jgi:hypothetical protein
MLQPFSLLRLAFRCRTPGTRLAAARAHAIVETAGLASTWHQARDALAHHEKVRNVEETARAGIAKPALFRRFVIGHHGEPSVGFSSYTRASMDVLVMEAPMENRSMLANPTIRFVRCSARAAVAVTRGHAPDIAPYGHRCTLAKKRSIKALW